LEPWLFAVAANRCRTALSRRTRRTPPFPIVDAEDSRQRGGADQLQEELQRALLGLRPEYRLAFLLFHEQELSYAEIATTLGRPLGTIKTWIHRARIQLMTTLQARGALQESPHALH
jgi:RNA polymerase sigma-70 factor (ECF subfamily)